MLYVEKPRSVNAIQFNNNLTMKELKEFLCGKYQGSSIGFDEQGNVSRLELFLKDGGYLCFSATDYIVMNESGTVWKCSNEEFEKRFQLPYERIDWSFKKDKNGFALLRSDQKIPLLDAGSLSLNGSVVYGKQEKQKNNCLNVWNIL